MDTIDWLLNSDPAISWQAMRDLTDASPAAIAAERARVPAKGSAPKFSPAKGRTARGTEPTPPFGCRPSTRCSSYARPAPTVPNPRLSPRWLVSRRASAGTKNSARGRLSRSSRGRWSRASMEARSRLRATSGARQRASRRLVGEQLEEMRRPLVPAGIYMAVSLRVTTSMPLMSEPLKELN